MNWRRILRDCWQENPFFMVQVRRTGRARRTWVKGAVGVLMLVALGLLVGLVGPHVPWHKVARKVGWTPAELGLAAWAWVHLVVLLSVRDSWHTTENIHLWRQGLEHLLITPLPRVRMVWLRAVWPGFQTLKWALLGLPLYLIFLAYGGGGWVHLLGLYGLYLALVILNVPKGEQLGPPEPEMKKGKSERDSDASIATRLWGCYGALFCLGGCLLLLLLSAGVVVGFVAAAGQAIYRNFGGRAFLNPLFLPLTLPPVLFRWEPFFALALPPFLPVLALALVRWWRKVWRAAIDLEPCDSTREETATTHWGRVGAILLGGVVLGYAWPHWVSTGRLAGLISPGSRDLALAQLVVWGLIWWLWPRSRRPGGSLGEHLSYALGGPLGLYVLVCLGGRVVPWNLPFWPSLAVAGLALVAQWQSHVLQRSEGSPALGSSNVLFLPLLFAPLAALLLPFPFRLLAAFSPLCGVLALMPGVQMALVNPWVTVGEPPLWAWTLLASVLLTLGLEWFAARSKTADPQAKPEPVWPVRSLPELRRADAFWLDWAVRNPVARLELAPLFRARNDLMACASIALFTGLVVAFGLWRPEWLHGLVKWVPVSLSGDSPEVFSDLLVGLVLGAGFISLLISVGAGGVGLTNGFMKNRLLPILSSPLPTRTLVLGWLGAAVFPAGLVLLGTLPAIIFCLVFSPAPGAGQFVLVSYGLIVLLCLLVAGVSFDLASWGLGIGGLLILLIVGQIPVRVLCAHIRNAPLSFPLDGSGWGAMIVLGACLGVALLLTGALAMISLERLRSGDLDGNVARRMARLEKNQAPNAVRPTTDRRRG